MSNLDQAGWGFPLLARKAHYFDAGELTSICGRWMFSGPRQPDNGVTGPDDCKPCRTKLDRRRETT